VRDGMGREDDDEAGEEVSRGRKKEEWEGAVEEEDDEEALTPGGRSVHITMAFMSFGDNPYTTPSDAMLPYSTVHVGLRRRMEPYIDEEPRSANRHHSIVDK
jgi:hypothetical protein